MIEHSSEHLTVMIEDIFLAIKLICLTIWLASGMVWLALAMVALLWTGAPLPGLREAFIGGLAWTALAFTLALAFGYLAHRRTGRKFA